MALITAPQLRTTLWNFTRVLVFLVVLSRAWALLVTYRLVPDFPDPVLAGLARLYEGFDALVEDGLGGLGNVLLGNAVFAVLLRFYAPRRPASVSGDVPSKEEGEGLGAGREEVPSSPALAEKRKEKGKAHQKKAGSGPVSSSKAIVSGGGEADPAAATEEEVQNKLDFRVGNTPESSLKRNIIILGRLGQCVVFLGQSYWKGEVSSKDVNVKFIDLLVSVAVILVETSGLKWDFGAVDSLFEIVGLRAPAAAAGEGKEEGQDSDVKGKEVEAQAKLKLR